MSKLVTPDKFHKWFPREAIKPFSALQAAMLWDLLNLKENPLIAAIELHQEILLFPYISEAEGELGRIDFFIGILEAWLEGMRAYRAERDAAINPKKPTRKRGAK